MRRVRRIILILELNEEENNKPLRYKVHLFLFFFVWLFILFDVKAQICYFDTKEKHFLTFLSKSCQINLCQVNLMFAEKQFL